MFSIFHVILRFWMCSPDILMIKRHCAISKVVNNQKPNVHTQSHKQPKTLAKTAFCVPVFMFKNLSSIKLLTYLNFYGNSTHIILLKVLFQKSI